jgi:hypothetical protein
VFDRISVWRDEYAPDKGAFARAADWATRLRVPLRVVDSPSVPGETFRAGELGVVGAYLTTDLRDYLLAEYAHATSAAAMVCPQHWRPNGRMLIPHEGSDRDVDFLATAAKLCGKLGLRPVVLTVAATERRAAACQELARGVLGATDADFDLMAGCELVTAVDRAARARGCAAVIMAFEPSPPWWRRLRGDRTRALLGLTHALGLVILPHCRADGQAPLTRDRSRCG